MSNAYSWIAARVTARRAASALRLRNLEALEARPANGRYIMSLRNGWTIIRWPDADQAFADEQGLNKLSRVARRSMAYAYGQTDDDGDMRGDAWRYGVLIWEGRHETSYGGLRLEGEPPEELDVMDIDMEDDDALRRIMLTMIEAQADTPNGPNAPEASLRNIQAIYRFDPAPARRGLLARFFGWLWGLIVGRKKRPEAA